MNAIAHVSVDLFPVLMLIIIFVDNRKRVMRDTDQYWFKNLNALMIVYFVVDIIYWIMGGTYEDSPGEAVWKINILYQIIAGMGVCAWFNYVYCRLYTGTDKRRLKRNIRIIEGICAVYILMVITTPWTKLIFAVGENNEIVRGPLFHWQYILCMVIALLSGVLAVLRCIHEDNKEKKKECRDMVVFNLLPFAGVLVQSLAHEWVLAAPCVAVSVLIIYINTQNKKITTDSLTRLNNRREFDQYIHNKAEQQSGEWGMLMLDLDDFKKINDTYGHAVGDEALWKMADVLKNVVGIDANFLARYGGDEFIVIGDWKNEEEVAETIRALEREVENFNNEDKDELPCRLSFSVGHAMWSEIQDHNVESLIEKADERMYAQKVKKKNADNK